MAKQLKIDQKQDAAGKKKETVARRRIHDDVLNHIQNKPGAKAGIGVKNAGQAVQLNPQPLPPGPDKSIGKRKLEDKFTGVKPHFDQKFQTGGNKNLKQDFNKHAITHSNSFKETVIPQTQSSKQFSEGIKHKAHHTTVEQFKGKTRPQNFNLPVGGQLQKWNR